MRLLVPLSATAALAALLSFARPSAAAPAATEEPRTSPYRVRPEIDLPVMGLSLGVALVAFIDHPPASCLPTCRAPSNLNALDRTVVGNHSTSAHRAADVLVAVLLVAPLVIDAIDSRGTGLIEDATVMAETVLATQAITQLTKSGVRRTAPFVYNTSVSDDELRSGDAARSFFSAHTSTAFAAATSFSVTFWLRHPTNPWRFVVLGVTEALALGVGLLKIRAGYHYPTDVAAGALVGSSLGVLIPVLHRVW